MGFWNETPNISYWDVFKSIWTHTTPPRLLQNVTGTASQANPTNPTNPTNQPPTLQGVVFKSAEQTNAPHYSKFISMNFPENLEIPSEIISEGFAKKGWIGVEARVANNLVGIVISKPISHLFSSEFPETPLTGIGLVDYFCISPAWRKRGIGTALLFKLHEQTKGQGRIPHIFASEGTFIFNRIPEMVRDTYIWRERGNSGSSLPNRIRMERNYRFTKDFLAQIQKGVGGKNLFGVNFGIPTDISHYFLEGQHILIRPTFEKKDGSYPVGEIIAFWSDFKTMDTFILNTMVNYVKEFDIFIAPSDFPQTTTSTTTSPWKKGASFGFFPFHFHPGTFDAKRLILLI